MIKEVIEKCYTEISESPESVSALLATDLISAIMSLPSTKSLHEQILKSFLLDKVVDPLLEGDDHFRHTHDHGHNHDHSHCNESNRQAAYIQIICNIADKIASSSANSYALDFFEQIISSKLVLIIDMGINTFTTNPMLFEKSLKLFASLSCFPNFNQIMTNASGHTAEAKVEKYANVLRDILGQDSLASTTVISVIGEQLEKFVTHSKDRPAVQIVSNTFMTLFSKDKLLRGDKVCLGLLNYKILRDLLVGDLALQLIQSHLTQINEETSLSLMMYI